MHSPTAVIGWLKNNSMSHHRPGLSSNGQANQSMLPRIYVSTHMLSRQCAQPIPALCDNDYTHFGRACCCRHESGPAPGKARWKGCATRDSPSSARCYVLHHAPTCELYNLQRIFNSKSQVDAATWSHVRSIHDQGKGVPAW